MKFDSHRDSTHVYYNFQGHKGFGQVQWIANRGDQKSMDAVVLLKKHRVVFLNQSLPHVGNVSS